MLSQRLHAFKWLSKHWLSAVDAHSLHSPFAFKFYQEVIKDRPAPLLNPLNELIATARTNSEIIQLTDMGAGSNRSQHRKLSSIAKTSHNRKVGRVLHRLVQFLKPKTILELGTNLGFSSASMALAEPSCQVVTIEGCAQLVNKAHEHWQTLQLTNLKVVNGNIDYCLEETLKVHPSWDLIYVDANHRYEATLKYFESCLKETHENSVMVIDDIHWSSEMSKAWRQLCNHKQVSVSMDLFQLGILFFDKKLPKKHYILE